MFELCYALLCLRWRRSHYVATRTLKFALAYPLCKQARLK